MKLEHAAIWTHQSLKDFYVLFLKATMQMGLNRQGGRILLFPLRHLSLYNRLKEDGITIVGDPRMTGDGRNIPLRGQGFF